MPHDLYYSESRNKTEPRNETTRRHADLRATISIVRPREIKFA